MWTPRPSVEAATPALQDRVQRHYARSTQADAPTLTTTDLPSAQTRSRSAGSNNTWQLALDEALARTNPLMEKQAALLAREAELAERERLLAKRETAQTLRIPELEYYIRQQAA